jgi:NAD(P)-dependent dehydrogenase (short-subunit alcohol dehydrogenase family)
MKPVDEQVVLVTGATDGIGKGTARELARMGATVLLHGRSQNKLDAVRQEIMAETASTRLQTYRADFSSLAQVRGLANQISSAQAHLDVLINNAGIGAGARGRQQRQMSEDGYELRFAVNHLASFLLTHLLVPLLLREERARVVNVASAAQQEIDFVDVMLERGYSGMRAYSQSKLAMVMATFEFARSLADRPIAVNCLHPGSLLDTKMVRESFGQPQGDVEEGIRAEIFVATAPEIEGMSGEYFDRTRRARAHPQAYDARARRRLWQLSEELADLAGERLEGHAPRATDEPL